MVNSTVIHQVDTHSVRVAIHDPVTIDFSDNPAYPDEATITEIAVIYTTTSSVDSPPRTEVTSITYMLDHKEHQTAFVHPDFLNQPDQWPTPVRELVDAYNPSS